MGVLKLVGILCFALMSSGVSASNLAGSGDTLAMLQKIQGQWRTTCRPVAHSKALFAITKLNVSFTHFSFTTTEYKSARCVMVSSVKEEQYQFALRGVVVLAKGDPAFAIDFKSVENMGASGGLYPLNIIQFGDGKLLLGDDFVNPKGKRLTSLNRHMPFVR